MCLVKFFSSDANCFLSPAEGPKHSLNLDLSQPYKFRQSNDRAQPIGPHLPEMPLGRGGSAGKDATTLSVTRPPT